MWLAVIGLSGIQGARAASFAYVPINDTDDGRVHVVDLEYGVHVAIVDVGANPEGVGISPDGSLVYVTNRGANSVSVIDAHGLAVIRTLDAIGDFPSGVAVHPSSGVAYVAHQSGVAVIGPDYTVQQWNPPAYGGFALQVSPDGRYVFVTGGFGATQGLSILNTADGSVVDEIPIGASAKGMVFDAPAQTLYIADQTGNRIAVVALNNFDDPARLGWTLSYISLDEDTQPYDVALNGRYLYVAEEGTGTVGVVDLYAVPPQKVQTLTLSNGGTASYPSCQFGHPVHPRGIATDQNGKPYVVKNIGCSETNGALLTHLEGGDANLSEANGTIWLKRNSERGAPTSTTYGRFVGPDCARCPRGEKPIITTPYVRPAALGWLEAALLLGVCWRTNRRRT